MAELRVASIEQRFGARVVLRDLDFALKSPRILGVIGASGSGKSTLLKLLAGLLAPSAGAVLDVPSDIAWVPQDAGLLPWLSIVENIALPLSYSRHFKSSSERLRLAQNLCREVGIDHVAKQLPATASGGERQRAALARAMAIQAKLLLLDEPFSALDAKSRADLRMTVRSTVYGHDIIAVIATHELLDVATICDEVLAIVDGAAGTYRRLSLSPSDDGKSRSEAETADILPAIIAMLV